MRTLFRTTEFDAFYDSQPDKVKVKLGYAMKVVADIKVLNAKLVKKLVDSDFYELRVSVGNEYRVILFTIDKPNIVESEQILLLN